MGWLTGSQAVEMHDAPLTFAIRFPTSVYRASFLEHFMVSIPKKFMLPALAAVTISLSGCYPRMSNHTVGGGSITQISYDSEWRGSTLMYRRPSDESTRRSLAKMMEKVHEAFDKYTKEQNDNTQHQYEEALRLYLTAEQSTAQPFILAEPPSQVAKDININVSGHVDSVNLAKLDIGTTTTKLFEVQGFNLAIRDAMYRLNEAYIYGDIDSKDYKDMFNSVLIAAVSIAKEEYAAAINSVKNANMAQAKADALKSEASQLEASKSANDDLVKAKKTEAENAQKNADELKEKAKRLLEQSGLMDSLKGLIK